MTFNRLLPVNSNVRYNAYLEELADICNITKTLTTQIYAKITNTGYHPFRPP